ncbi:Rgg/GadR/MutR family transcriptional regulator [Lactobacillus panisapium]|uniref:Helix-turn-helix domain-containing protein n=1 Tax=Lactobacillus panisapium TaxID=2012495 RepID=A0ABX8W775_9LACO|nr:Rgg/GadR/MutR family transcriptional regulator [Lactobacillus panisapium]QYN53620.1 helix-turn-helix domain-containing protein [Lactobacillus panisapium]
MNNKFGKKFKQIRKQKGISLDTASRDITSKSSLYYWEKGQANMSFEKVIAMLERMRIKPSEFVTDSLSDNLDFKEIATTYYHGNDQRLKELATVYLKSSQQNPYDRALLLRAAIACNLLKADTEINLFTPKDLSRLEELLSEIEDWYYEDLFNFGNTLFLLPGKRVFGFAHSLLVKYQENDNDYQWQHAAIATLINANSLLLYTDFHYAQELYSELKALKLSDNFAYEKIRLKFLDELILFIKTKDDSRINEAFFPMLDYLNFHQLKLSLQNTFSQLKQSYNR